jgi:glycosyltransferase involved in cell wall biosynthesis
MGEQSIAYVLMGYPRISELFIASEIARMEQQGTTLRLIVLKPSDEATHHPVVDRIKAKPVYLQDFTSLSDRTFIRWLRDNLPEAFGPIRRVAVRHPLRVARTAGWAAAQAWRDRRGWRPRAVYLKEWMRAAAVADELSHGDPVTHIHAHFAHRTTTVTWWAAHMLGLPFSFTGHAKDIYQTDQNPHGLLARKMHAAEFVVTCTDANRQHLEAIAPGRPVHVMYHGLNADFARLLADAPPVDQPERLRIISVGRLVDKKGFDVLVEAIALLTERGVEVNAVIAGESGDREAAIRRQVTAAGLDSRIEFLGTMSQADLFAEYRRSSVFALACRITDDGDRDGIPNVLMEAMAAGLPVVSTSVSGIPELIEDDVNGLLVPPEDAVALADAIWRLSKDPALTRRLATAGATTIAEHFDGEALARHMAGLFAGRSSAGQP